jgi:enoyl-CoA hydratase
MEDPIVVERSALPTTDTEAAFIILNRPDEMNAINEGILDHLGRALHLLDADPRVRVIFVTGRGRAFSAGADLKEYLTIRERPLGVQTFIESFQRTMGSMRFLRKPIVALVNGITVAGGLELMLACDFAYAAQTAQIGDAHLKYGQIGGGGTLTLLPRLIGPSRARELLLSARVLNAQEALDWGLVNRVVPDTELRTTALEFATGIATRSPAAIAAAKYVMNAGIADGTAVDSSLRLEGQSAALHNLTSSDAIEGLRAFAEHREPRFGASS